MKFPTIKIGRIIATFAIILGASALLPQNLLADGLAGPPRATDAKGRLTTVRANVAGIQTYLKTMPTGGFGGYIEKATADANQALADLDAASAYIEAHPEANRLLPSTQAPADPTSAIGQLGSRGASLSASEQNLNNVNNLVSTALRNWQNTPAGRSASTATFMGDLGGNRAKVFASLAKVNADLLSAYSFFNSPLQVPSAAAAAALGKYQGQITLELADTDGPTVIEIPKKLLDGAASPTTTSTSPTAASVGNSGSEINGGPPSFAASYAAQGQDDVSSAEALPVRAMLPSIFASVALSGALALGGLYLFSRPQRIRVNAAAASLVVGALVLGLGISYGNSVPPPPPAPPPPPPPAPSPVTTVNPAPARGATTRSGRGVSAIPSTPPPHVSGNATVYVVTSVDSVHIILSRKNVADLLGQPPAR